MTDGVAFLDNASTTQKPHRVIDTATAALGARAASAGRGSYPWARRLSADIAVVRGQMAEFLGASSSAQIVFTAGATAAMNAVALGWGLANLVDGDEVVYCRDDHTSVIAPWIALRDTMARFGVGIRLVPFARPFTLDVDAAAVLDAVTPRTRLILLTHVHGVHGGRSAPAAVRALIDPDVLLCVDACQSAGHEPLDVRDWGADFVVVAGHKMFAAPGVGVLYCAPRTHPWLRPFLPGGAGDGVDSARMPALLEGGTPNAPAILSLGAALDFLGEVGVDTVAAHTSALVRRACARLRDAPGVLLRSRDDGPCGIVACHLPGVRPGDVGFVLAESGIYVRAGGHCVGLPGSAAADAELIRLSAHVYNTGDEMDRACDAVARIAKEGS